MNEQEKFTKQVVELGQLHVEDVFSQSPISKQFRRCWICRHSLTNSRYGKDGIMVVCPDCVKTGKLLVYLLTAGVSHE